MRQTAGRARRWVWPGMVLVLLAPLPCMPPFGYAGASFVGQQHHQQHQQQQHQQQRGPGGGRRPDPTCFTADVPQFTVERCCNSALGADGDVTCWGGGFGFARCCPDPNAPPVDGRGRGGRGSGGERLGGFNGQGEDIKKRKIVQADFLKKTDPLLSRMELLKKFHARQQRIGKVLESSGGTGGKLNDFKLNDDSPETQKPTGQKFFSKLFPAASSGQAKPEQTRAASTSMDNMRKQPRRKKGRVTLDDVRAACPGELKVCEENGNNCGNEIKLSLKGELVGPPSPELRAVMKCYEPRRRGAPLLLGKSAPAQCLAAPGVPDRLVSFCNALCQRPSAVSNRCPPMSCCEQCVKSSGAISFDAPEPWEPQLDHSPGLLGLTDIEAMVPFNDDLTGDEGHQGWCTELRYLEDVVYCTIASFIPADAHVVDGGAHWGETLRLMQASFGSSVEIHSFEAMKINFQRASRHATERTQMVNAALTDEEGKDVLTIICNSENCDNEQSTLSEDVAASNAILDRKQRVRHEVKVPAMRLDKYLATLDQFPFFIKLDLEGMDFPVIRTLPAEAKIILWEHNPSACRPLNIEIRFMKSAGYEVYRMTPFGLVRLNEEYIASARALCYGLLAIAKDIAVSLVPERRNVTECLTRVDKSANSTESLAEEEVALKAEAEVAELAEAEVAETELSDETQQAESASEAAPMAVGSERLVEAYLSGLPKAQLLAMPMPGIGASQIEVARSAKGKHEVVDLLLKSMKLKPKPMGEKSG